MTGLKMPLSKKKHKCKFCNNSFARENTLANHMCVRKRRYADKDRKPNRLGFKVYLRFFKLTTRSKKPKTVEDFIASQYYNDFVRFGRYLAELKPINTDAFVDYVIKNGVKLKDWTKEYVYDAYLKEHVIKEPADKALERTIVEMEKWAKQNNDCFRDFFRKANENEATFMIRSGRISPWVLYLSESGDELFKRLNEEHGKIIDESINPEDWEVIFEKRQDEVEFVASILDEAGI